MKPCEAQYKVRNHQLFLHKQWYIVYWQPYHDINDLHFINIANALNGNLLQGADYIIENLWNDAVWSYVKNDKSKEDAIADFKDQVKATLGYSSN